VQPCFHPLISLSQTVSKSLPTRAAVVVFCAKMIFLTMLQHSGTR
jgi:hypothetical protein